MKARIRKMRAWDRNFVRSSWLNVWTQVSGLHRLHTAGGMGRLLDRVLENPRTVVTVAVDPEDDVDLLGYVVRTGDILHMALTKRDHRKAGVCRALLSEPLTIPGEAPTSIRCWWPSPNLEYIQRVANVTLDPLSLLEL